MAWARTVLPRLAALRLVEVRVMEVRLADVFPADVRLAVVRRTREDVLCRRFAFARLAATAMMDLFTSGNSRP